MATLFTELSIFGRRQRGFIALVGVAVETVVIMLVYLSPTTEGETIPIGR